MFSRGSPKRIPLLGLILVATASGCKGGFTNQLRATSISASVIIGAICLVAFVLVVCMVFSWLDLTDRTQALALPDGSVRALIALILLSAFISIPIYLYSNLSSGIKYIDGVSATDKPGVVSAFNDQYIAAVPSGPAKAQVFRILP